MIDTFFSLSLFLPTSCRNSIYHISMRKSKEELRNLKHLLDNTE